MGQINLKKRQQRIAFKDSEYFLTSSERYSVFSAEEIIDLCSENSGIPKAQMASAFYALSQQIKQFLLNGHTLELPNLGHLYLSVSAKAVKDEKDAGAKAVRRVCIKFRQTKELRNLINNKVHLVNISTESDDDDEAQSGNAGSENNGGQASPDSSQGGENGGGTNTGGTGTIDTGGSNTGGTTGGDDGNDGGD